MQMRKKLYIFKHFAKSKELFFCQYLSFSEWFLLKFQKKFKIEAPYCTSSFHQLAHTQIRILIIWWSFWDNFHSSLLPVKGGEDHYLCFHTKKKAPKNTPIKEWKPRKSQPLLIFHISAKRAVSCYFCCQFCAFVTGGFNIFLKVQRQDNFYLNFYMIHLPKALDYSIFAISICSKNCANIWSSGCTTRVKDIKWHYSIG